MRHLSILLVFILAAFHCSTASASFPAQANVTFDSDAAPLTAQTTLTPGQSSFVLITNVQRTWPYFLRIHLGSRSSQFVALARLQVDGFELDQYPTSWDLSSNKIAYTKFTNEGYLLLFTEPLRSASTAYMQLTLLSAQNATRFDITVDQVNDLGQLTSPTTVAAVLFVLIGLLVIAIVPTSTLKCMQLCVVCLRQPLEVLFPSIFRAPVLLGIAVYGIYAIVATLFAQTELDVFLNGKQNACGFNPQCFFANGNVPAVNQLVSNFGFYLFGFVLLIVVVREYNNRQTCPFCHIKSKDCWHFALMAVCATTFWPVGILSSMFSLCPRIEKLGFDLGFQYVVLVVPILLLGILRKTGSVRSLGQGYLLIIAAVFCSTAGEILFQYVGFQALCGLLLAVYTIGWGLVPMVRSLSSQGSLPRFANDWPLPASTLNKLTNAEARFDRLLKIFWAVESIGLNLLYWALFARTVVGYWPELTFTLFLAICSYATFLVELSMTVYLKVRLNQLCTRPTTLLTFALCMAIPSAVFFFTQMSNIDPLNFAIVSQPCAWGAYDYAGLWRICSSLCLLFLCLAVFYLDDNILDVAESSAVEASQGSTGAVPDVHSGTNSAVPSLPPSSNNNPVIRPANSGPKGEAKEQAVL